MIDDFVSGTAAAAAGGTTTIVDFAVQQRGQSPAQTIAMWQDKLAAAALPAQGITSFKLSWPIPAR